MRRGSHPPEFCASLGRQWRELPRCRWAATGAQAARRAARRGGTPEAPPHAAWRALQSARRSRGAPALLAVCGSGRPRKRYGARGTPRRAAQAAAYWAPLPRPMYSPTPLAPPFPFQTTGFPLFPGVAPPCRAGPVLAAGSRPPVRRARRRFLLARGAQRAHARAFRERTGPARGPGGANETPDPGRIL
ncbi:hypothetical protein Rsub_07962 [Raphidocelis subcapitata]|uniref:Uncharacterized protein n=1 Tax=Raphidocelis subcapitata TaxID=307507 RepID=A0A2V0PAA1_9CHLO|nr:hypothetical protein Rsub_07962 [Raphidocelis subcapitata]|eukprot:GBF94790.1 hypothetical protein Rsub_07962 [Raphidocelis subcapitata]